ncbi:hypothetical protein [Acetobacter sicerae]|uniref:hypothetical protein n=1 Tax=Acetobacter sicerae TaxID=85325 RepID=UPI00156B3B1F|nr:hypothetical protein [Acetobacter sicerae]NHN93771.1 hypothetical protein [Acetobacter sicerae]
MLKTLFKPKDSHSVAALRVRVAHLEAENARFLGVVAAKEREIATLKDELRGRDRKIAALKQDCVGRFV